jgi:hypothetical protein
MSRLLLVSFRSWILGCHEAEAAQGTAAAIILLSHRATFLFSFLSQNKLQFRFALLIHRGSFLNRGDVGFVFVGDPPI